MKPWREVAIPHSDVLKGTFQQAEFAADITAVRTGKAPDIYKDAVAFYDRTFITEGMRLLLTQVAQRLAGQGGEPVIQLQTAFGGGKTHTMLAVWHLATRQCDLSDMPGVASLVEAAGLMDVPQANVAVIDGTAHSPGQAWKSGRTQIKTLWGELAWQLGKADGYAMVADADATGTSPGKEVLQQLLEKYAPCVVLIDELVAYISQFEEGQSLSGGTFESNLAFVQALTEAAKVVPNAIVLASLPESELEVGTDRGKKALGALEKRFGRVQALWKPVATEEAFEIVRRRLFEPIQDDAARNAVCRAFADTYTKEGAVLPTETQEGRYYDRLVQAYPIHPEFFDRLYEDWSTIDGFQRTRGVLKLMAKVINRLWKANNGDLMVMPGNLPLAESDVRNELTALLPPAWDPVITGDIDGERAETTELEGREPRFGQVNAARRVARTLFLGTAPSSVALRGDTTRGLTKARVLLGCLQPDQPPAVYTDALGRIADRLHYLNTAGDKTDESARYWFGTHANLRREMEDRKRLLDEREVGSRIEAVTKKLFQNSSTFEAVHTFTPHGDVPDDSQLRLVVLSPAHYYMKEDRHRCDTAVLEYLKHHGNQPRHRANRLVFVAPDHAVLGRLNDAVRSAMAWESIVADVQEGRLNIDQERLRQAQRESKAAVEVLPRAARECFKWLLCPVQDEPTATTAGVEALPIPTATGTAGAELDRVCGENELVIDAWSPIHLRSELKRLYWKADKPHVRAMDFWEDSQRYVYLPRLKSKDVLATAIRKGSESSDFFGTAYGMADDRYEGFSLGKGGVSLDDTLLLIEPGKATELAAEQAAAAAARGEATPTTSVGGTLPPSPSHLGAAAAATGGGITDATVPGIAAAASTARPRSFHGSVSVSAATAKSQLVTLADEIVSLLASDPTASVRVTLEIGADFPEGANDQIKRAVSENANALGFDTNAWE
jgi:predicted AAA+ superfamily ATPase